MNAAGTYCSTKIYPHVRIYENEGQPEWQLDFALSFDLTQAFGCGCEKNDLNAYVALVATV